MASTLKKPYKKTVKRTGLIIAELGTLHLKSPVIAFDALKETVKVSDYVKFQIINPLTAFWANAEQRKRYSKFYWDIPTWYEFLKQANKDYPGKVFASVFDPSYVKPLNPVMPIWKVALRMRGQRALIDEMLSTGKKIFYSTNDHFYTEDSKIFAESPGQFVPFYATPYDYYATFLPIHSLRCSEKRPYRGFSLNFGKAPGLMTAKIARKHFDFLELHAKVDRLRPAGPDAEWSFGVGEIRKLRLETDGWL